MMNKTNNLRFLLALGSKKVVVMQGQEDLQVYTDQSPSHGRLFVERISNALTAR